MADPPRILIGGSTLFSEGGPVPRPLAKSRVALERLRELGEPVVLVSRELGGHPLPAEERDRVAWVRDRLDVSWLTIVSFDESGGARHADLLASQTEANWARLRSDWSAASLLTGLQSSVGAARRAGLMVIRIGARGSSADPTQPRADYEAIDLLDAVRHLLFAEAFDAPRGEPRQDSRPVVLSGSGGPAAAARPDVLQGG